MEFQIMKQTKGMAIGVKLSTTPMKLAKLTPKYLQEIKQKLTENKIDIIDAPVLIYYTMGYKIDVAIGYPVKEKYSLDEYEMFELESGSALTSIHEGPYMKLRKTYKKMTKYMVENNLEAKYLAYEYYLNSPENVSKKELRTKVVLFIKEDD